MYVVQYALEYDMGMVYEKKISSSIKTGET